MKLPDILKSKKGQAFLSGLLALCLKDLLGLDAPTVTSIVALVGSYVLGQGIADHGKEKAKVESDFPPIP